MRVRLARAAHSTRPWVPGTIRLLCRISLNRRCKCREVLGQLRRPTMGAFGAFPLTGTHQHFAVFLATLTMKLVKRHRFNLTNARRDGQFCQLWGAISSVGHLLILILTFTPKNRPTCCRRAVMLAPAAKPGNSNL